MLRQAAGEGVAGGIMGVAQVVGTRQLREDAAVVDEAADRNAAEADAVIAALAPDQAGPRALADGALIGDRDLESRIDRFRTRAGEEHPLELVRALARSDGGKPLGEIEHDGMAHLEGRGEIEIGDLVRDGFADLPAAMAGIAAPEARGAVQDLAAVLGGVMHAAGAGEQARRLLELPVRGERHPESVERTGILQCGRLGVDGHGHLPVWPVSAHVFVSATSLFQQRANPLKNLF